MAADELIFVLMIANTALLATVVRVWILIKDQKRGGIGGPKGGNQCPERIYEIHQIPVEVNWDSVTYTTEKTLWEDWQYQWVQDVAGKWWRIGFRRWSRSTPSVNPDKILWLLVPIVFFGIMADLL